MADHSQKWHDGSSSRNIDSSSKSVTLRESLRLEAHLDKECPLNEEVKSVEEVKYDEFGRPPPFNGRNSINFFVLAVVTFTNGLNSCTTSSNYLAYLSLKYTGNTNSIKAVLTSI
uniref:Uncharacterized protein n=1 Tax=Tanacetum cinerariifolium TaxID=118510 RepID=A0A6L2K0K3_TANCI|nr:hypothetical protein [Tanacetum cinerariifolium]